MAAEWGRPQGLPVAGVQARPAVKRDMYKSVSVEAGWISGSSSLGALRAVS